MDEIEKEKYEAVGVTKTGQKVRFKVLKALDEYLRINRKKRSALVEKSIEVKEDQETV